MKGKFFVVLLVLLAFAMIANAQLMKHPVSVTATLGQLVGPDGVATGAGDRDAIGVVAVLEGTNALVQNSGVITRTAHGFASGTRLTTGAAGAFAAAATPHSPLVGIAIDANRIMLVINDNRAQYSQYTPTTGADWDTPPTNVFEALDELADRLTGGVEDLTSTNGTIAWTNLGSTWNAEVVYGAAANTAVQGNQTAEIVAGNGLTGGITADALGDGFSATLTIGAGAGITVNADDVAINNAWFSGDATVNATGVIDISDNAVQSSEINWGSGADEVDAGEVPFVMGTPLNWTTAPIEVEAALNELANRIATGVEDFDPTRTITWANTGSTWRSIVNFDNAQFDSIAGTGLQIRDDAITSALILDGTVAPIDLNASVAGNGLTGGAGSALAVGDGDGYSVGADNLTINVANGIEIVADALQIDEDAIPYTPAVLADWDGAADPGMADQALDQLAERITDIEGVTGFDLTGGDGLANFTYNGSADVVANLDLTELASGTDGLTFGATSITVNTGAGLFMDGDNVAVGSTDNDGITVNADDIAVNVDGATIEINADALRVMAAGIDQTHIDWGTGANQVSAVDVPFADGSTWATAVTDVENALAQLNDRLGAGVEDGTAPNQTLRWDGTSWVTSGALLNDDTNVSSTGDLTVGGGDVTLTGAGTVTGTTGLALTATTGAAALTSTAGAVAVSGATGAGVTAATGPAALTATAGAATVTAGTTVGVTGATGVNVTATANDITLAAAGDVVVNTADVIVDAGQDFVVGTIGLNDAGTSVITSGSHLIGYNTTVSGMTAVPTVQVAIDSLDARIDALTAGAGQGVYAASTAATSAVSNEAMTAVWTIPDYAVDAGSSYIINFAGTFDDRAGSNGAWIEVQLYVEGAAVGQPAEIILLDQSFYQSQVVSLNYAASTVGALALSVEVRARYMNAAYNSGQFIKGNITITEIKG